MSVRSRQIIFILLTIIFAASAPLLMLYASGYRYNFKKKILEKTGALVLDSTPEKARILINGNDAHKLSPARFPRLLPGEYVIRMEKEGYHWWEKTLRVESKRTTFATDVVFFKNTSALEVAPDELKTIKTDSNSDGAASYKEGNLIYFLKKNPSGVFLSSYPADRPQEKKEIALLHTGDYLFLPSPHNLLTLSDKKGARLYVIDPSIRDPILLEERATFGVWSPKNKKLLLSDDFELHIYEPERNQIQFITRYGKTIKKALWLESEAQIILTFDDAILGVELDSRGERYSPTLAEMKNISNLILNKDMDTVYFLSQTENGLKWFKLPIL